MRKKLELIGKRFGRLTVEKKIRVDPHANESIWECICDCGAKTEVRASLLLQNKTTSCGCYKAEVVHEIMKKGHMANLEKNYVFDTSLRAITQGRLKNNTSGCTGVTWNKSRQKWDAEITFQKKKYRLGRYAQKKDAISARKTAENKLHGEFLEWYYSNYPENQIHKVKN